MAKDPDLWDAEEMVRENLESLRIYLINCVDEGMIDLGDELYNQIITFIEETSSISNWDDLSELIVRAKTLERDIDVWLSLTAAPAYRLSGPLKNKRRAAQRPLFLNAEKKERRRDRRGGEAPQRKKERRNAVKKRLFNYIGASAPIAAKPPSSLRSLRISFFCV